jgi:hypothetical protein
MIEMSSEQKTIDRFTIVERGVFAVPPAPAASGPAQVGKPAAPPPPITPPVKK